MSTSVCSMNHNHGVCAVDQGRPAKQARSPPVLPLAAYRPPSPSSVSAFYGLWLADDKHRGRCSYMK